ncbi:MAG: TonB-dependent receptor [Pseudomonadota bacterium]|uniref:TonB-dependent receptor plug domain-containing protein n=1 Tax=Gallaecimonas pentaromativorans TaxID=584787 RepID=UPI00067EEFA2|nr:TonB-dependent receptor [Gallaecimonas pentaromativorans]MED5524400.1 TonB-dependent receptor [Pseudomonadota bacterium]
MYRNSKLASSVRWALLAGATTAAVTSIPTYAADGDQTVERIEVTGSRIKRTDIEGASPVTVIDQAAIQKTGIQSLGDLLQELPGAGSALNTAVNNGGSGATEIDLRHLGSKRVLVLLNGRRMINGIGGGGVGSAVDLNTIPLAAVKRIEVLKDGASAVYGSDAIAGVVNVITKDDFDGAEASAYWGRNAKEKDGTIRSYEFTVGTTGERGNMLLAASYTTQDATWAGDRDISKYGYSSTTPGGHFRDFDKVNSAMPNNAQLTPGTDGSSISDYEDYADAYNYAPQNYLQTPQDRKSVYALGNYDITDNVRLTSDFLFTNRQSSQLLAAMPLTIGSQFGVIAGSVNIDESNPYNIWGTTLYGNGANNPGTDYDGNIRIQRRVTEAGNRIYTQDVNTYRWSTGLSGGIGDTSWTWDINYIYGKSTSTDTTTGLLNYDHIKTALGDVDTCNATSGCVPLNLFGGEGSITQGMVDYITFTGVDNSGQELRDITANITGDLFELPAGAVQGAFGVERRDEKGFDTPDPLTQIGASSGNQRDATTGSFNIKEAYAEFFIPVLDNLTLSTAARYSKHNAFGSETTTKFGVEYRPIDDLLLRATKAEGFRAPSIAELYQGGSDSYDGVDDPCNGGGAGAPGCAGVPTSYEQSNAQIRATWVSNPDLKPEKSDSFTVGFVYNPSWLEGFNVSVDYYDIEVKDTIGRIGSQTILDTCAETGTVLCQYITRDATTGDVIELENGYVNSGKTETKGYDFTAAYSFGTSVGDFKVSLDGNYMSEYKDTIIDLATGASSTESYEGYELGDDGYPRLKANLSLDWNYDAWSASWETRFIDGMTVYPYYGEGVTNDMDNVVYNDVQAGYFWQDYNVQFTVGIDNVFNDKPNPEYSEDLISSNNFDVTTYRANLDRFMYFRVSAKF